jgi:hypothetical protein
MGSRGQDCKAAEAMPSFSMMGRSHKPIARGRVREGVVMVGAIPYKLSSEVHVNG